MRRFVAIGDAKLWKRLLAMFQRINKIVNSQFFCEIVNLNYVRKLIAFTNINLRLHQISKSYDTVSETWNDSGLLSSEVNVALQLGHFMLVCPLKEVVAY